VGFKPQVQPLAEFQDGYGYGDDGQGDDDDEEEDDDEEGDSEGSEMEE